MSSRKGTKLVNIGGDKNDRHYRYKRESLAVRQESASVIVNAYAKTQITNLNTVADQIGRPLQYLIKYFSTELGTQTNYDKVNHLFKLNGLYTDSQLEAIVESFIEKFVLCKACGNPETSVRVLNKNTVKLKCAACGKSTELDPTEKISNYIAKNPPKTNKMATAAKKTTKEEEPMHFSVTDEDWNPDMDTSAEAVARRREEEISLGFGVQELEENTPKSKPTHPVDLMRFFVENHKDASTDVAYKAASKVRKQFDLTRNETVCLVFEAVFTDENFLTDLPKWKDLFLRVIKSRKQQVVFLRNVRRLIRTHPKMIDQVAAIFDKLYDLELVEEETFLEWNDKESDREESLSEQLVQKAEPFINWLKKAEVEDESGDNASAGSESDDDSDEDESDEDSD